MLNLIWLLDFNIPVYSLCCDPKRYFSNRFALHFGALAAIFPVYVGQFSQNLMNILVSLYSSVFCPLSFARTSVPNP